MRFVSACFSLLTTVAGFQGIDGSSAHRPQPPHIVLIVIDDLGWNDVSVHGSAQIPTPHIDVLARDGVLLNNYYVNPVCSPTRASLLSGRAIIHHGIFTPFSAGSTAEGLNLSYPLLPTVLKSRFNYRT
jgi:arylsulfatase A-like enzyme